MFRATTFPSSGAEDCVMLSPPVGMCRGYRKAVKTGWQGVRPMDELPANLSWQPSCSHGTYQQETITSRSRQRLMMGTWLPETCWATSRREIKNTKVTSSWFFLSIMYKFPRFRTTQNFPIHIHSHCNKQLHTGSLLYLPNIICPIPLPCVNRVSRVTMIKQPTESGKQILVT
jgi:hypothetical protein